MLLSRNTRITSIKKSVTQRPSTAIAAPDGLGKGSLKGNYFSGIATLVPKRTLFSHHFINNMSLESSINNIKRNSSMVQIRSFAKSQMSKSNKKKSSHDELQIENDEVNSQIESLRGELDKAMEYYKKALAGLRTGRASPEMLQGITVDIKKQKYVLGHICQVTVSNAEALKIIPNDPSMGKDIVTAVQEAGFGLAATFDGTYVYAEFPKPTKEFRQNLIKLIHKAAEEAKLSIRRARQNALSPLKKLTTKKDDTKLTNEELKEVEGFIQKIHDDAVQEVEALAKSKESDVMK